MTQPVCFVKGLGLALAVKRYLDQPQAFTKVDNGQAFTLEETIASTGKKMCNGGEKNSYLYDFEETIYAARRLFCHRQPGRRETPRPAGTESPPDGSHRWGPPIDYRHISFATPKKIVELLLGTRAVGFIRNSRGKIYWELAQQDLLGTPAAGYLQMSSS